MQTQYADYRQLEKAFAAGHCFVVPEVAFESDMLELTRIAHAASECFNCAVLVTTNKAATQFSFEPLADSFEGCVQYRNPRCVAYRAEVGWYLPRQKNSNGSAVAAHGGTPLNHAMLRAMLFEADAAWKPIYESLLQSINTNTQFASVAAEALKFTYGALKEEKEPEISIAAYVPFYQRSNIRRQTDTKEFEKLLDDKRVKIGYLVRLLDSTNNPAHEVRITALVAEYYRDFDYQEELYERHGAKAPMLMVDLYVRNCEAKLLMMGKCWNNIHSEIYNMLQDRCALTAKGEKPTWNWGSVEETFHFLQALGYIPLDHDEAAAIARAENVNTVKKLIVDKLFNQRAWLNDFACTQANLGKPEIKEEVQTIAEAIAPMIHLTDMRSVSQAKEYVDKITIDGDNVIRDGDGLVLGTVVGTEYVPAAPKIIALPCAKSKKVDSDGNLVAVTGTKVEVFEKKEEPTMATVQNPNRQSTTTMLKTRAVHGAKVAAVDATANTVLDIVNDILGDEISSVLLATPKGRAFAKLAGAGIVYQASGMGLIPSSDGLDSACGLVVEASSRDLLQGNLEKLGTKLHRLARLGAGELTAAMTTDDELPPKKTRTAAAK